MNTKLEHIQNWSELAKKASWSVTQLAGLCAVSTDTLRRYFLVTTAKSSRQWLSEDRQRQAMVLLRDGSSIKEAANCLGYKQQTNFTRKFKEHWGVCPRMARSTRVFRNSARK
jgi:transcriptional regulator GlxA family with amidase domain